MRSRFDRFIVDSSTRQLLRDGEEVHLSRKAFDLLCLLVTERPRVVSKQDLLDAIWPDAVVAEANLNVLVREIRRALDDDAAQPRFLRTVHGVGYAFCADATTLADERSSSGRLLPRVWLVGGERTFVLSEGENLIGRDPRCAVWLDDVSVSRRHARIRVATAAARALVDDLGSTNGTLVGNRPVTGEMPITDGDVITVGTVELTVHAWHDDPPPTRRIRRDASATGVDHADAES